MVLEQPAACPTLVSTCECKNLLSLQTHTHEALPGNMFTCGQFICHATIILSLCMFIRLLLHYCVSLETIVVKYRLMRRNLVGSQLYGSFSSRLDGMMPEVQVTTSVDFFCIWCDNFVDITDSMFNRCKLSYRSLVG